MNARQHLGMLPAAHGRPELVRAWVGFFGRIPLWGFAFLGVLWCIVVVLSVLTDGDVFLLVYHLSTDALTPADSRVLWRGVLMLGGFGGGIAIIPRFRARQTGLYATLPWFRERHAIGMALFAIVYMGMIAVAVALCGHVALAFALFGVGCLAIVYCASFAGLLAPAPLAMLGLYTTIGLIVFPDPIVALADRAPIGVGLVSLLGVVLMLAKTHAPATAIRQGVGALDITDVQSRLPRFFRWLAADPTERRVQVQASLDQQWGVHPGQPQTFSQWARVRLSSAKRSPMGAILAYTLFVVVLPTMGYLFGRPDMAAVWGLMVMGLSGNDARRLPTLSRRQRARRAFRGATRGGAFRLVLLALGIVALAAWNPLPDLHEPQRSVAEVGAFLVAAFMFMLPVFIYVTTRVPRPDFAATDASAMLDVSWSNPMVPYWVAFFAQMMLAMMLADLAPVALAGLRAALPSVWPLVVAALFATTYAACWIVVRRRYMTKDLII
jgi:hypothetical protein